MFILQINKYYVYSTNMFQLHKSCKVEIYTFLFQIYDSRFLLWLSVTCNESYHRHHRSVSKLMIYMYITKHAALFMFKGQSFYQRSSCLWCWHDLQRYSSQVAKQHSRFLYLEELFSPAKISKWKLAELLADRYLTCLQILI